MAEKAAYEKRGLKPPSKEAKQGGGGNDTMSRRSDAGSSAGGMGATDALSAAVDKSEGPPQTGASTTSRSRRPSIPIAFRRPILSNAHERLQRFSSESGVTYSAQQQLRKREAALLK